MVKSTKQQILEWLQEFGSINFYDALEHIGTIRLPARISELRQEGYDIRTEMKKSMRNKRYAEYVLFKK